MKSAWDVHWEKTAASPIERKIEAYKTRIGYRRLIEAVSEIGDGGLGLEVGAGKASMCRLLRQKGWRTVALDSNSAAAEAGKAGVELYLAGDVFALPFKEKSFDLVLSCGLLEHFREEELNQVLKEMTRVGQSVVAWIPTCGPEWQAFWWVRNILGGGVYSEAFQHSEEKLAALFLSAGMHQIRTGRIHFAGLLTYLYVYGST
jgi:SAM-dependent methyltransferase